MCTECDFAFSLVCDVIYIILLELDICNAILLYESDKKCQSRDLAWNKRIYIREKPYQCRNCKNRF